MRAKFNSELAVEMRIAAGTWLGPYETVSPLGAGGMGEVYRARDARLGREVAIKVLPLEYSLDLERLRRFEQEARAAASLNHPNIMVVYDIGIQEGTSYMVTELLEGETLRLRLREGPLALDQAEGFSVQIARGLAAAHGKGIVHRDLKPDNILVTGDGVIKILDFGLARLNLSDFEPGGPGDESPGSESSTQEGEVLGTMGHMSPEQIRGKPAGAEADIFAMGLILYEMFSGRKAFPGASAFEVQAGILKDDPAPLSRRVPFGIRAIVRRCLEKSPDRRFSSAHDLLLALEAVSGRGSPWTAVRSAIAGGSAGLFSNWPEVLIVAAVVLSCIAAGWAFWHWKNAHGENKGPPLRPERVAVAVFENQTGDPALDTLGRMASDWITEGLSRLGCVDVVPASLIYDLGRSRPAAERGGDSVPRLAEATGAGLIVTGTCYAQGQRLEIQAKLTDATAGKLIYVVDPVSGQRERPMEVVERIRRRVVDAVAARQLTPQNLLIEEARPPSYEAYREFLIGEEFFGADYRLAVAHFNRALELDPDFVLPLGGLLVSAYNSGDYQEASRQYELLERRRPVLTPVQRRKDDFWRARLGGREEEALSAIRDVVKLAVGDINSTYMLAADLLLSNRPKEAVEVLDSPDHWELFVTPTRPIGEAYFWVLCTSLHLLGQHGRELGEARRGRAVYPDHMGLCLFEADALIALGRLKEAHKVSQESFLLASGMGAPGDALRDAAIELRVHGHGEMSRKMAGDAAEWYSSRPAEERGREGTRHALGCCLYLAGRWEEATTVYGELASDHPDNVAYQGALGALAVRRGDRTRALKIADNLAGLNRPYLFGGHTYQRARIAALLDRKGEAVGLLREAISQGLMDVPGVSNQKGYAVAFHRDMDLELLHGYPPYEELVKPKG